jgi:hypothetical protein
MQSIQTLERTFEEEPGQQLSDFFELMKMPKDDSCHSKGES